MATGFLNPDDRLIIIVMNEKEVVVPLI
ncbi:hypothetical protein D0817_23455 [Flavobacterium cupreum]|uniref:Uncharacterized protein n=2 Tax=Flavobacterium TaxID=237 RepID=A0A4Y7UEA8_9FLAO|nr:hypothetical protein D0817_23455 [Flavobacterium cupreum]TEB44531.1 hypothetical protein D0809_11650 [Flavobacterium circumlabens]